MIFYFKSRFTFDACLSSKSSNCQHYFLGRRTCFDVTTMLQLPQGPFDYEIHFESSFQDSLSFQVANNIRATFSCTASPLEVVVVSITSHNITDHT
jgi:hypothetical protein